MVDAYNFIASWQLFPERGNYEWGTRPKSGIYRIEFSENTRSVKVTMNWVTLEDQAFTSSYSVYPDGEERAFENPDLGDSVSANFRDATHFEVKFFRNNDLTLVVLHEITPKGYLQVTQRQHRPEGALDNIEVYHKQLSVLPYSASVSGALIRPTEEGVIRHHALSAMEEQTNMQLTQIRQQIELLAIQAKEIQKRKELSAIIYDAQLGFHPVIGQTYYLYEKTDGTHLVSMVSPKEWGKTIPFKSFVAAVQLLADHTWKEV